MRITATIPGFTHYRWAVTRDYRTHMWCVVPSRRSRVGTEYGPSERLFGRKEDAKRAARELSAPDSRDFERPKHGVEVAGD